MKLGGETLSCVADRRAPAATGGGESPLIAVSPFFRQVLSVADSVAGNSCIVLLEGESGTGKELIARRIHKRSTRSDGPFIPVNCPGVTDTLFESQFFGHVKGSFTGATVDTLGVVRAAEGGSLLLDEVGELPLHLQPKLLRLLQEREVTPVGTTRPQSVNVRFIAATNRNLSEAVRKGDFRADLYHRLNIVRIEVPPLRARPEDVEPLLDYYLAHYAAEYGLPERLISSRLRNVLKAYPWPGNVRELCAYVERLYATDLPPMPPNPSLDGEPMASPPASTPLPLDRMPLQHAAPVCCSLAEAEANAIRQALDITGSNRTAAAKLLEIHRSTLLRKMRVLGIGQNS